MTAVNCLRGSVVALVIALSCAPAIAQPGGRGGFGGRGGGGMAGLLMSDEVREELEISEDQQADLRAMGDEMRDQMRSMFEGMRDLPEDERRARFATIREDMQDLQAEAEGRLQDVLLPHQVARLKEINLQQQVRRDGLSGALRGDLAEELGITDEQREQMVAKAQELQAEMQQKIAELRKDAQDELMSLLTAEQRSKIESMLGTDFEMQERGFGGRRGGGGTRGGRGRPSAE